MSGELTRARVEAVDAAGLAADILAIPDHLRDALWRADSARLERREAPGGLVVAGMGGSGIGGRLALAILGDRLARPLVAAGGYVLPPWTGAETCVLCASYSGDTEETVAAYAAAGAAGARRIVATTGGRLAAEARADGVPVIPLPAALQPRSAVAYMTVAALAAAAACGAAPLPASELEAAATSAERLLALWGPDGAEDGLARELARGLHGTTPVLAGAGLTVPVAYRWKTQLNENAKLPAFASELPELDHNEVVGWEGTDGLGPFSAVFLEDPELDERERRRIGLTLGLLGSGAAGAFRVVAEGDTRAERVFSLVVLGDLVSLYVAVLRGLDPTPVPVLERLKAALAAQASSPGPAP